MQWDPKNICEALNARIEKLQDISILNFNDNNFIFSLQVQPEAEIVILAADFVEPNGMPLFEYSCNCSVIKVIESSYDPKTNAVYFFEDTDSGDGVRLALNLRHDGNWYIWCNTWRKKVCFF